MPTSKFRLIQIQKRQEATMIFSSVERRLQGWLSKSLEELVHSLSMFGFHIDAIWTPTTVFPPTWQTEKRQKKVHVEIVDVKRKGRQNKAGYTAIQLRTVGQEQ